MKFILVKGLKRYARGMRLVACAGVALFIVGCSTPQPMATRPMEDFPFRQRQAAVRIGVDPLFRREQLKTDFPDVGTIAEQGLLPVRVQIENGGPQEIQAATFTLTTAKGSKNVALSPDDAASLLKTDAGMWRFVPIQIVGQSAMAAQNSQVIKQLVARALPATPVPAGASSAGLVYFYFPPNEQILTGAELEVMVTSAAGDTTFTFALRGRRDMLGPGAPPERSATPPPAPARPDASGQGVIIRSPAP